MPIMMASLCARIRWTRSRTASPVIATGLRPARRRLAVGRDRKLEHDVRAAVAHAPDVAGMIAARLVGADADIDRDAGGAQPRMALPATSGLGSSSADTTRAMPAAITASAQGGDLAVMRARLERDVERRAARRVAGAAQRLDLGMRPAAGLGPAAADDHAVLDDDRADRGVRPGAAKPAPAERTAPAP